MEKKVAVTLTDYEQRVLVRGMNEFRNQLVEAGKATEDVDRVMLKVIQAPSARRKGLLNREAR